MDLWRHAFEDNAVYDQIGHLLYWLGAADTVASEIALKIDGWNRRLGSTNETLCSSNVEDGGTFITTMTSPETWSVELGGEMSLTRRLSMSVIEA